MHRGGLARVRATALGALMLVSMPLVAACGSSSTGNTSGNTSGSTSTTKQIKIGLVTDTGGLNDKSFNHLAYVGEQKAVTELHVKGDVKQSTSTTDYVPNLQGFASQNYDLVIAVGFLMAQAVGQVAQQYPNVHFAIIDAEPADAKGNNISLPNVESLLFKEQEAGALVGVVAGMLEKSGQSPKHKGVISAVGGQDIPPVDHYIAGYQWGATQEDSSIKVLVGFSNDFSDPTKCRDLANTQMSNGSDIVFQVAGGCGNGALTAAGTAGNYSIGVDADQASVDKSVIASAVKRVDVATFDAIKDITNNAFKSGDHIFSLANDGVGIVVDNKTVVGATIQAEVTKIENEIKNGSVTVPDTISK